MAKASHPGAYARFAGASLLVCALIAVVFTLVSTSLVRSQAERDAALAADGIAGEPLRAVLGASALSSPLPLETTQKLEAIARPLLSGDVRAIDIWTEEGQLAYSTRENATLTSDSLPGGRGISTGHSAAAGGEEFFVFSNEGSYTIQITQPAGVVAATGGLERSLVALVALSALLWFALLQAVFWFGIRGFTAEHRRLRHLYNTGQEIRSSLDLQDVLAQLTRDTTQIARGQYGLVTLFEEETGDLILRTTYAAGTGALAEHQRSVEEWFVRRAAATNTTIVSIQPVGAYKQLFGPEMDIDGRIALLCVPISLRERVIGVIAIVRTIGAPYGNFSPAEVQLAEELAAQAVMAVEQALLFAKVRSYADELETSYDTTLKVLMAALDTKDEVTEGHCERVSKLTVHLARGMGAPEASLLDIERGALLHDVGKIGVPDTILKKPRALNKLEWEAMQKHPLLAGLIVSKVGFLEGALPILLYHHERYDGQGYPFGLVRDKIPLEARIFSVVDSYDAMTSDRPYRSAMSYEDAMDELRRHSGTQFDPDVIEVFEKLMEDQPELRNHGHGPHTMSPLHDDHDPTPPIEDDEDAA